MPHTTMPTTPDRLPRGRHRLSRDEVEDHQRRRLVDAMIVVAGTKGYAATTIRDVTKQARVSRDTFYQQYANKEECFLAAYERTVGELIDHMVAAGTSVPSYAERVREGVRSYLGFWSVRPEAARLATIESMAAGAEALAARDRTIRTFTHLFGTISERARKEQPDLPVVPEVVARAVVVAAVELVTEYVRAGRAGSLPEIEDDMVYLWLMGLAGHDVAAAAAKR